MRRDAARTAFGDPVIRRTYLASVLGGGGRGLGIANLYALLYITEVLHLPDATTNLMYAGLVVLSVPMPLVAGCTRVAAALGMARVPATGELSNPLSFWVLRLTEPLNRWF